MTDRFAFGRNWQRFLRVVDEERIRAAEDAIKHALRLESLAGLTFLDVGCGSGLSSLAARRLGATVRGFDQDRDSVACSLELKRRFRPGDRQWTIEHGSILDEGFVHSLGKYDIVYAWGVLHHTGALWRAVKLASDLVTPGGSFYFSIYNDQGNASRRWLAIKRFYNRRGAVVKWGVVGLVGFYFGVRGFLARAVSGRNPFSRADRKAPPRGMSRRHDLVDWVGGYPFETASPGEVFVYFRDIGWELVYLKTVGGGLACNEYVFRAHS